MSIYKTSINLTKKQTEELQKHADKFMAKMPEVETMNEELSSLFNAITILNEELSKTIKYYGWDKE